MITLFLGLEFFMVPIHTKPSRDTALEIDALRGVFYVAAQRFRTNTGMIIGDMNCGCGWVPKYKYDKLVLRNDPNFKWWITSNDNTGTDYHNRPGCALDR